MGFLDLSPFQGSEEYRESGNLGLLDLGSDVLPETLDDFGTEFLGAANFMLCMGIGMRCPT